MRAEELERGTARHNCSVFRQARRESLNTGYSFRVEH